MRLSITNVANSLFCSALVFAITSTEAFASAEHEAVHNAASAAAEHEESSGLPQLDPQWLESQVFWILATFVFLYIWLSKKSLPDVAEVLENRDQHVQSDLVSAEKLFKEAEEVKAAYEASIASAREEAKHTIANMENSMKEKIHSEMKEAKERADREISEAEKNIYASKVSAMSDVERIAAEAAELAISKVLGEGLIKVKEEQISGSVKRLCAGTN